MSETTYHQNNKEMVLRRARRCYHDNIEVLREKARNNYRGLSEEKKI